MALPTWVFFRGVVTKVEARTLAVLSATGLPIIVVITTLGVSEHRMKPQNAAALVAAGMLSVLIYPLVGLRWLGKGQAGTAADRCRNRLRTTTSDSGAGPGAHPRRVAAAPPAGMAPRIALAVAGRRGHRAWVAGDIAARYLRSFTLHQGLFPTNLDDAGRCSPPSPRHS